MNSFNIIIKKREVKSFPFFIFKLFLFKYIQKNRIGLKYFFNKKENKYTKIKWKDKTYFIETSYIPYDDIFIQIKLIIWHHDSIMWISFKKNYYSCYIISTKDAAKKSIEKELIKVFGLELEKLIRTEKRKEEIKKLLGGK